MNSFCEKYDAKIYPREAVIKAAYTFIKSYYVHLAYENDSIIVSFTAKEDEELPENVGKEFENELLAQVVRVHVYNETHVIREILMARAMSSSMVYKNDPIELFESQDNDDTDEIDSILEDWFKGEKQ
jgi:His-Xaa-Ser system protein HxsD